MGNDHLFEGAREETFVRIKDRPFRFRGSLK